MGSLASASTGMAIACLSDVAATNATLAAGGTADLGGIVAASALLVADVFMENKADEAMNDARSFLAESRKFLEVCESYIAFLETLETRAQQI